MPSPFSTPANVDELTNKINTFIDKPTEKNPYVLSEELAEAVKVALLLGQPLLITGEPGTGKTKLAECLKELFQYELFIFNTKTTSTSKELLYNYDMLQHFVESQITRNASDIDKYIRMRPLGDAFSLAEKIKEKKQRSIVLIDEIDKAPRDFPNDLLNELDRYSFEIKELKEGNEKSETRKIVCDPAFKPFIIITSNTEKSLPEPFLRRCVFHHISFSKDNYIMLDKIVEAWFPGFDSILYSKAKNEFVDIRDKRKNIQKKPATAEFIGWFHLLLEYFKKNPDPAYNFPKHLYAALAKNKNDLEILQS